MYEVPENHCVSINYTVLLSPLYPAVTDAVQVTLAGIENPSDDGSCTHFDLQLFEVRFIK